MELIKVHNLKKIFHRQRIVAVDNVSFSIFKGEIFGIMGESGCGKSTLAKSILRLIDPEDGMVLYKGENLLEASSPRMRALRKFLQIIFQDSYASLDPRATIGATLEEVFIIHDRLTKAQRRKKTEEILELVGLDRTFFKRLPFEISGGERQRVGIARALATDPEFIICDEPVSNLDISIQAQILNLLMDLQKRKNLTYLFISHDPDVISSICDRVAVMRRGKIIEMGLCEDLFNNPKDDYTKALLNT